MNKISQTLFFVLIFCTQTHADDDLLAENRTVRSLILLDENIRIENVVKGRVYIGKDLTEDPESMEGLDDSEKLKLMENPLEEICVYFSFESKLKLEDIISHSSILKNSKIEKVSVANFCDDFWIVPKFPKDVLHETNGVSETWYRDYRVFRLYMVASPKDISKGDSYTYYGCSYIDYGPTNGVFPKLRFDKQGKITEELEFKPIERAVTGVDQSATKPADKVQEQEQPSTSKSKDHSK